MAVKICPKCGGKVAENSKDCIHCGFVFDKGGEMTQCPECEEWVHPTENGRCPVCGHYFVTNKSVTATIEPLEGGGYKAVGCSDKLASKVIIPVEVRVIAPKAFYGMKNLEKVTIPSTVETVGDEAFAKCPNLVLNFPGTVREIGKNVLRGTKSELLAEERKRNDERIANFGNPRVDGEFLYFGCYPQNGVEDAALIEELNGMAGSLPNADEPRDWIDYCYYSQRTVQPFMWYKDIVLNDVKYRGVYFKEYRPYMTTLETSERNSMQTANGYSLGLIYWFAFTPIKWKVMNAENGILTIISAKALDAQQYYHLNYSAQQERNGKMVYANNYAESDIRYWLNDNFYNTAFTEEQKEYIQTTLLDNGKNSTGKKQSNLCCEDTEDKVFLLSVTEATSKRNGFVDDEEFYDKNRQKKSTDYAKAQGCSNSAERDYAGNCWWWTRSPSHDSLGSARRGGDDGDVDGTSYIYRTNGGIVPAMRVKI